MPILKVFQLAALLALSLVMSPGAVAQSDVSELSRGVAKLQQRAMVAGLDGDVEKASSILDKALKKKRLTPYEKWSLLTQKSGYLIDLERNDEALTALREANQHIKPIDTSRYSLGMKTVSLLELLEGNFEAALAAHDEWIAAGGMPAAHDFMIIARAAFEVDNQPRAIELLDKASSANPRRSELEQIEKMRRAYAAGERPEPETRHPNRLSLAIE